MEKTYTLEQVRRKTKQYYESCRECKKQFLAKAKEMAEACKDKIIHFDPDNTVNVLVCHKHDEYSGDVLSLHFDEEDKLHFEVSSTYDVEDVYFAEDACYGAYIDDWGWALQILLELEREPYEPDEEDEDDDAGNDGNEDSGEAEG